jgi:hypothetical protein
MTHARRRARLLSPASHPFSMHSLNAHFLLPRTCKGQRNVGTDDRRPAVLKREGVAALRCDLRARTGWVPGSSERCSCWLLRFSCAHRADGRGKWVPERQPARAAAGRAREPQQPGRHPLQRQKQARGRPQLAGGQRARACSPPGGDVGGQPVQALVQALARGGAGALDVPAGRGAGTGGCGRCRRLRARGAPHAVRLASATWTRRRTSGAGAGSAAPACR